MITTENFAPINGKYVKVENRSSWAKDHVPFTIHRIRSPHPFDPSQPEKVMYSFFDASVCDIAIPMTADEAEALLG